jgi:kumamolisin
MKYLFGFCFVAAVGCTPPPASDNSPHIPGRTTTASALGLVPGDEVVDVVLGVHMRDRARLVALVDQRGGPGAALSPADIAERFGPTADDYATVVAWAEANGLTVTRQTISRTTLSLRGTASVISRAFGVQLRQYKDSRGVFRAPASEPAALQRGGALYGLVDGVIGLDTAARYRPHNRNVGSGSAPHPNAGFTSPQSPAQLRSRYGVDATTNPATGGPYLGEGATLVLLGSGYAPSPTRDLDKFLAHFGQATTTTRSAQYTQVFVGGANRNPVDEAQQEYGENCLDACVALGMAPKVDVVHIFVAQNAGGLFADGISFAINNVPQAHAVSVSYGTCERIAAFETALLDSLFTQALAQGQTWFFSSGDYGTDDCQDGPGNKVLTVEWPASSPHTFGVGGTQLNATTGVEEGWFGSGGGLSEVFLRPSYQDNATPYPMQNARNVPDVAALAGDPAVSDYEMGALTAEEGTSAAAPMWGATWAILDQARGYTGSTNPHERIYSLGANNATVPVFTDPTTGANPGTGSAGYNCLTGYDLVTGWGSPNLPALIANY